MSGEDIKTKVCSKCGKELPLTDEYFYKNGDRYRSECKECKIKRQKEYYETHKDQICERIKKRDEVHKEKTRQYKHNHYARVKDTPEYKERRNRNVRKHRQRVKDEFFAKRKKPCQKCGEQRLYLIQFHHIDPATKGFDISKGL